MRTWMTIIGLACALSVQAATPKTPVRQGPARVAVTDLAYQERVQEYFHSISAQSQSQDSSRGYSRDHEHENAYGYSDSHAEGASSQSSSSSNYNEQESLVNYIQQAELRKFSGDIKGEIIKSGLFQIVQGAPYTQADTADIYDIIKRIKQGQFKGADYVLFGTVSDVDFQQSTNNVPNTNRATAVLGLTLVADFSLIDTRTFQVTSAFTASGEAQDTKILNGYDQVSMNRPRVIRDVSKAIGEDVTRQLREQLLGVSGEPAQYPTRSNLPPDEPARILR